MDNKFLNSIVQTKQDIFVESSALAGTIYFVRTDDHGEEGYIYLNKKKYGNVAEVYKKIQEIEDSLPESGTTADLIAALEKKLEATENAVNNLSEEVENDEKKIASAETRITKAEEDIDALESSVSANTKAISDLDKKTEEAFDEVGEDIATLSSNTASIKADVDQLNGDENVEGSVDQKIKEAIENLPADMVVEGGRVEEISGETCLVLTIKGGEDVVIPATKLVDTYKSGDEYINVEGYEITLNVEKVKEALDIDKLATKEELEDVSDKLDETISGLTEAQNAISDLDTEVKDNEKAIEANSKAISAITEDIDGINVRLSGDEKDIKDIKEALDNAQNLVAGSGITISGNTIAANSDATTTDDIEVTVDLGAGMTKGTVIPAGTSLQDLLVKLLSKELWATSVTTGKTFTASVGKPTATLDKNGTVEVGTVVTFTSNASTAYTSAQTVTAKTMTYGYYDGSKEATLNTATTYTETLSPTKSGDVVLATSYAGFANATAETVTATSITVTGLTVSEGANTASVKETGATVYAQTNVTEKTLYVATNLKNTTKSSADTSDWTVSIPATWNGTASIATSNNNSASVTGAYKYYYGFAPMGLANTLDNLTDAEIYAMSSDWITKDGTTTIVENDSAKAVLAEGNVVVAVPSKYKLASILEKLSGNSILENFKSEKRTLNIGGTSTTEYTVYYYSVAAAPTYYNVTITKA